MHTNATLQQRQQRLNEVQRPVLLFQALHGLTEDGLHALLLFLRVEVEVLALHEQGVVFALPMTDMWKP